MTGRQIKWGIEASRIVRGHSSGIPIVWGGVHPSLLPEQTARDEHVDVVVRGEGEAAFSDLVDALDQGRSLDEVAGLVFLRDGEVVDTGPAEHVDLDRFGLPDYDMVDVDDYITTQTLGRNDLAMITSRGCPHECAYCYNVPFTGRRWRALGAEAVVDQIRTIRDQYGIGAIILKDDNFFVDRARVEQICEILLREKIEVMIRAECRADYIARGYDIAFLKHLRRCGFREFTVGAESGSAETLEILKKAITPEDILEANRKLGTAGIPTKYTFMAGYPHETMEHVHQTLRFMLRLIEENPSARLTPMHLFTPYPGTECYDEAVRRGFTPPASLADWSGMDFHQISLPWISMEDESLLTRISYVTYFLDGTTVPEYFTTYPGLRRLFSLYARVIQWRCRGFRFGFMPEIDLFNAYRRLTKMI